VKQKSLDRVAIGRDRFSLHGFVVNAAALPFDVDVHRLIVRGCGVNGGDILKGNNVTLVHQYRVRSQVRGEIRRRRGSTGVRKQSRRAAHRDVVNQNVRCLQSRCARVSEAADNGAQASVKRDDGGSSR